MRRHRPGAEGARELRRWAAHPVTAPVLVNTAVCLVWLLWAWLLYAVVADVLTRLRQVTGRLGRLRVLSLHVSTPMQAAASSMVGAVVLGLSGGSNQPPAAGGPAQPATVATQPATTAGPSAATDPTGGADHTTIAGEGHGADHGGHHPDGVALPDGGWVPQQTATAIAAAAGLVWIQRRRRYLPRRPVGVDRDDTDLTPLPITVAAVQAGLHPLPDTADEAGHDHATATQTIDPGAVAPPSLGQQAGAALHPADLPAGGVGLTGAGAADAARGILAATLLAGGPRHPGHGTRLITTADLHTLLGPHPTASQDTTGHDIPRQPVAGLYVAATLDQALAELDGVVLTRLRAMATGQLGDPTPTPAHPTTAGPFPPIVVLVTTPPTAHAHRLAVMLALAAPLGISGVLLGAWPHAATWHVAADGTTHPAERPGTVGPRLCVLSATAAGDLLTVLREAHPRRDRADPPAAGPTQPPQVPARTGSDNPGHPTAPPRPRSPAPPVISTTTGVAGARPPAGPVVGEPAVWLRVLGPPAVHRAGPHPQPVAVPRSAALQILIFLAVHPHGASSSQLVKAIWPGTPPRSATASLYTAVKHLRANLREATDTEVIIHTGEGYRLDPAHVDVDLWRLRTAVAEAATALDPTDRHRALRQVIAAYTGELAATAGWLWLQPHREAIRRHVIDAHTDRAAADPDPRSALALLQDAIRVDPYNEELHRQAMRRYATASDPTAVRHLLHSLTERLAAAGLQPQPATTRAGHEQATRSPTQPRTPPD